MPVVKGGWMGRHGKVGGVNSGRCNAPVVKRGYGKRGPLIGRHGGK